MKPLFIHIILACVLLLTFCSKPPEYSTIPYIEFREVTIKTIGPAGASIDCTYVKIFFRDGDGNLGINSDNATDQEIVKKCGYNYSLDIFMKENGTFVPLVFPDTVFNYKKNNFLVLSNSTSKGPLEGELTFTGLGFFTTDQTTPNLIGNDTIKFQVKIKDRDCNESNQVESNEVVVNKF